MTRPLWRLAPAVVGLLASQVVATPPALAAMAHDEVVAITFPTDPVVARFGNDFDQARSGGRAHMATDIVAPKHTPAYAAADGVVCYQTGVGEPEPSWGFHLRICGDDGVRFDYVHLNNDTPGTDDGRGGPEHAYAKGIVKGAHVVEGQLVAWVGDSGNAEETVAHLHFEMSSPEVTNPYGTNKLNPHPSLQAAIAEGRVADPRPPDTDTSRRLAGKERVGTALAVASDAFDWAPVVVLARSDVPWPAMVGGPLAAVYDGPVVTTAPGKLDPRVHDQLQAWATEQVHLVGPVEFDLAASVADLGIKVVVHDAGDRFTTSARVAEAIWQQTGATRVGEPARSPAAAPGVEGQPVHGDLLAQRGPSLAVTTNRTRTDQRLLAGATVRRPVAIELLGLEAAAVAAVDFWIPGKDGTRVLEHRDDGAPYDAVGVDDGGPQLFDVAELGVGDHLAVADITFNDGRRQRVQARFAVRGADDPGHPVVGRRRAIVALGQHAVPSRSWPDALMASWAGSVRWVPVLLTPPDVAPQALLAALRGAESVWVVGGTGAISDGLAQQLVDETGVRLTRLAGPDRYRTALAVADDLVSGGLVPDGAVWLATGHNWPDATAAGPAIASAAGVLLLVNGTGGGGDDAVLAWLRDRADRVASSTAVGGPAAIAAKVMAGVVAAAGHQQDTTKG